VEELTDQTSIPTTGVTAEEGKRHFARNVLSSIAFFAFNAGTSLYFVPYQIRNLGMVNYGMVTLAQSFPGYLQVVTVVIIGAVGRFVTFEVARKNHDGARAYVNTQMIALVWLLAVLTPVCALFSYFAPSILRIPQGQAGNVQALIFLVLASSLLTLPIGVLRVSTFIRQRFDFNRYLDGLDQAFRYSTWVSLFTLMAPALWHIGTGYMVGTVVSLVGSWILFRKLTPELKIRLHGFDGRKFREMTRMSGWQTIGQIGVMLYLSLDVLIINRMIGPEAVGKYGTVMGLSLMLRGLAAMIGLMMGPMAIAYHARRDYVSMCRASARAVKFQSLVMAIPLGIMCGLSVPFIAWWLGPKLVLLHVLVWLMLAHLVWNLGITPLFGIATAMNKIAIPGIATIIGGLAHVGLAITLVKYTNLGIYGVAISSGISLTVKNLIFTPIYSGRIMGTSSWPLFKALAPSVIWFAVAAAAGLGAAKFLLLDSFLKLLGTGAALFVVCAVLSYFLTIGRQDRQFASQLVFRNRRRES